MNSEEVLIESLFAVILRDMGEGIRSQERLEESEARLRSIVDSAMDAIITVDEDQQVVMFNKAAEEVFGWPREEAIGAPLESFIPQRFRAEHAGHMRRFGEGRTSSRRMGESRVVKGLRRSGGEFPIDASISQITEGGRRFFTVVLRDVTRRVQDEQELRHSRDEIRSLAMATTAAREQEKSRIARELHDELGQALTALKIDIGWLRERIGKTPEVVGKLEAMQDLLDSTVAAARRISADLRPLMLDDLGLGAAIEWLVENFRARTGIDTELEAREEDLALEDPYATAVFRVLQESLTNIAKHAGASKVHVRVVRDNGSVDLTVQDDGRGFSADDSSKPGSFGLLGLRERASLLQGEVSVDSTPGKGTTVHMRIPLAEAA
jgi:PAS domain S-box-containing protein